MSTLTSLGLHIPESGDNVQTALVTNLGSDMVIINDTIGLHSMARQACPDGGNFSIAQLVPTPGTEITNPANEAYPLFDLWVNRSYADGGTPPTVKISQHVLTPGELPGSRYCLRTNVDGAGVNFGVISRHGTYICIEDGVRLLCGTDRKISVSFRARSDIVGKKVGCYVVQHYGTGGSPSTADTLVGDSFVVTSEFDLHEVTFSTVDITNKTFGSNNDSMLLVHFIWQWGSSVGSSVGDTAESFVGAGNMDLAQVQINTGDIALPFEPMSYADELRACQRYYEIITGSSLTIMGVALDTSTMYTQSIFYQRKRRDPTVSPTGLTYYDGAWRAPDSIALSATKDKLYFYNVAPASGFSFTAGKPYMLGGEPIIVDARF